MPDIFEQRVELNFLKASHFLEYDLRTPFQNMTREMAIFKDHLPVKKFDLFQKQIRYFPFVSGKSNVELTRRPLTQPEGREVLCGRVVRLVRRTTTDFYLKLKRCFFDDPPLR